MLAEDAAVNEIGNCFQRVQTLAVFDSTKVIKDFMLDAINRDVVVLVRSWAIMIFEAWRQILSPILVSNATMTLFKKAMPLAKPQIERMKAVTGTLSRAPSLRVGVGPADACDKMEKQAEALVSLFAYFQNQAASANLKSIKELMAVCEVGFVPFSSGIDPEHDQWTKSAATEFGNSKLVAENFNTSIRDIIAHDGDSGWEGSTTLC